MKLNFKTQAHNFLLSVKSDDTSDSVSKSLCKGSKLWCNVIPFHKYIQAFLQAKNSMTGGVYIGEVLIQAWLKSIELLYKQVNAQKESLKNTS